MENISGQSFKEETSEANRRLMAENSEQRAEFEAAAASRQQSGAPEGAFDWVDRYPEILQALEKDVSARVKLRLREALLAATAE